MLGDDKTKETSNGDAKDTLEEVQVDIVLAKSLEDDS
jgi:hypothetical protein